uniref:Uncharacterized protein n=1 Tax=Arundo donax TaxID=35708 RepID=A0A0A9AI17_ARUDO
MFENLNVALLIYQMILVCFHITIYTTECCK